MANPNPLIEAVKEKIQVTATQLQFIADFYQAAHDNLCEDPLIEVSTMGYDLVKANLEASAVMVAFTKQQHEAANS